jgi:hypothetical protein
MIMMEPPVVGREERFATEEIPDMLGLTYVDVKVLVEDCRPPTVTLQVYLGHVQRQPMVNQWSTNFKRGAGGARGRE